MHHSTIDFTNATAKISFIHNWYSTKSGDTVFTKMLVL